MGARAAAVAAAAEAVARVVEAVEKGERMVERADKKVEDAVKNGGSRDFIKKAKEQLSYRVTAHAAAVTDVDAARRILIQVRKNLLRPLNKPVITSKQPINTYKQHINTYKQPINTYNNARRIFYPGRTTAKAT